MICNIAYKGKGIYTPYSHLLSYWPVSVLKLLFIEYAKKQSKPHSDVQMKGIVLFLPGNFGLLWNGIGPSWKVKMLNDKELCSTENQHCHYWGKKVVDCLVSDLDWKGQCQPGVYLFLAAGNSSSMFGRSTEEARLADLLASATTTIPWGHTHTHTQ